MAFKSRAISVFLLLNILLAMAGHVLGTRAGPTKQKEEDMKKPEWFIEPDGSVLIPGIGRILVPMPGGGSYGGSSTPVPSYGGSGGSSTPVPSYGGSGGSSTPVPSNGGSGGDNSSPDPNYDGNGGDSGSTHIPGGDDTLVPNPGYEVPVPSTP